MTRQREEVLNVRLAEVLRGHGVTAAPETIADGGRQRPDIALSSFRGMRVVVEGKLGDAPQARTLVDADARHRIDSGIAQLAIAVVYPEMLRECGDAVLGKALAGARFDFAVFSESSRSPWRSGSAGEILSELRRVHEDGCRQDAVEQAAARLSRFLDGVADLLEFEHATCDRLSALLGFSVQAREKPRMAAARRRTAAKVSALTVANAFIFQEQLAAANDRARPLSGMIGLPRFKQEVAQHWRYICETINYVPIFEIAVEILHGIPSSSAAEGAIRLLAEEALAVSANKAALRHDLMGRIYHFLLHEAKFLGTYYTSVPAATLLLKLALDPAKWATDFSDADALAGFRVADLTCGTGTLLMSACQGITDNFVRMRYVKRKKLGDRQFSALHRTLMESSIHGYDVLPSAIHLTASSLLLVAPEVKFDKLNLYCLPLSGRSERSIKLGSLDFLHSPSVAVQFGLFGEDEPAEASRVSGQGMKKQAAALPEIDLFAMNSPFVRSVGGNLLFGSLPDAERARMQEHLKAIVRGQRLSASITSGLGGIFLALADRFLKKGGRLAFVLPAALATGEAWRETRAIVNAGYHLEYAVMSHDAGRWSFSENTDLSEMLFVARKLRDGESGADLCTTFVNLWRNPENIGDALSVARLVQKNDAARLGAPEAPGGVTKLVELDEEYGELVSIPMRDLDKTWWGGAFAQVDLLRHARFLAAGSVYVSGEKPARIPVVELSRIAAIGPDCRDVHDGFSVESHLTAFPAYWNHNAESDTSLKASINAWLNPLSAAKPGRKLRKAADLWPRAGRLLIAERLRLTSQRIAAMLLPQLVLSNTWWVVRLTSDDERAYKALTLWMNGTPGLATFLLNRVPTEGPWLKLKKPALEKMAVLDVTRLTEEQLDRFGKAFDDISGIGLEPFRAMGRDPARKRIDDALSAILGLPSLDRMRAMLGFEAIVTGMPMLKARPHETNARRVPEQFSLEGV
jgi:hypothetical protein